MKLSEIKRKINALREKTVANGCTEAEAMNAAALVARLMAEHGVSEADLKIESRTGSSDYGLRSPRSKLWGQIGWCTNTSCLFLGDEQKRVQFVGRAPWPDVAMYLRHVCDAAIDREVAMFKLSDFYRSRRKPTTRRKAVSDFTEGMVLRLRHQLYDLFSSTRNEELAAAVKAYHAEQYPAMRIVKRAKKRTRFRHAANQGYDAGGNVNLRHGVGDTGAPAKQIGSDRR